MGGVVTLDDRHTPANLSDDGLHYVPAPGFIGIDTLTYQVRDPSGHTDTATVSVLVSPTAPRGADLSVQVDRDVRTLAVDVLAEAHTPSGESLYLHGIGQPAYGAVTLDDGSPINEPSDAALNVNAVRLQTSILGHFALVQADDGRVGAVGTVSAHPVTPSATASWESGLNSPDAWQAIGGTTTTAPYVIAWDTTQVPDGNYELRAICTPDAAELAAFENPSSTASGGGQGDSDCFISAAYGSPVAPPVQTLRHFRDTYLRPYGIGRWLVIQYGRLSPALANMIRRHSWWRAPIRTALTLLVWGVKGWDYDQRHPGRIASLLGLFTTVSLGGILRWRHAHATSALSHRLNSVHHL